MDNLCSELADCSMADRFSESELADDSVSDSRVSQWAGFGQRNSMKKKIYISMSVVAAGRIALPSPDGVALSGLETVVARCLFCACYMLYILY